MNKICDDLQKCFFLNYKKQTSGGPPSYAGDAVQLIRVANLAAIITISQCFASAGLVMSEMNLYHFCFLNFIWQNIMYSWISNFQPHITVVQDYLKLANVWFLIKPYNLITGGNENIAF